MNVVNKSVHRLVCISIHRYHCFLLIDYFSIEIHEMKEGREDRYILDDGTYVRSVKIYTLRIRLFVNIS